MPGLISEPEGFYILGQSLRVALDGSIVSFEPASSTFGFGGLLAAAVYNTQGQNQQHHNPAAPERPAQKTSVHPVKKAQHLTLDEEVSACTHISVAQSKVGRLWAQLLRQKIDGNPQ